MNFLDRPLMQQLALCKTAMKAGTPVNLRITGISMLPALWPGDWVSLQPALGADLRLGDVVAFARDGRVIVHRVVSLARNTGGPVWITRGDGQSHDDLPLLPPELLGVVSSFRRFLRFGADRPIAGRPSRMARAFATAVRRSPLARFLLLRVYGRLLAWIFVAKDPRWVLWFNTWQAQIGRASRRRSIAYPADKPVVVE